MRALQLGFCLLLLLGASGLTAENALAQPKADETGMVPGDIVLGNIANFPGHAGIYVGKWRDLPERLRARYAHVYDNALIRSQDMGLKRSFLVVDSDGGRGVRLTSFAEQFTYFLVKGSRRPKLAGALTWEAKTGMAMQWPSLAVNDPRRWDIVEEALQAAVARVRYDDGHMQRQTTGSDASYVSYWSGRVEEARTTPYSQMDGLDCIALAHVVYWRGAGIDLDVSWKPWHAPDQLYSYAREKNLARAVLLEPVWLEAAFSGAWKISLRWKMRDGTAPQIDYSIWIEISNGRPQSFVFDLASGELRAAIDDGFKTLNFKRTPADTLLVEGEEPSNSYRYEITVSRSTLDVCPRCQSV